MMTRLRKTFNILALFQLGILFLLLVSLHTFVNFETAFVSSMLVMLGSMYSYRKLVMKRVASSETPHQDDLIEKIDDPYDLYGEEQEHQNLDEVDIKAVIKDEKKRLKTKTVKNTASGAPAMVSIYRMVPYVVLVLGFITLNNNHILMLLPYMSGLGVGVLGGLLSGRVLFVPEEGAV
jgi:hypothetical protein